MIEKFHLSETASNSRWSKHASPRQLSEILDEMLGQWLAHGPIPLGSEDCCPSPCRCGFSLRTPA